MQYLFFIAGTCTCSHRAPPPRDQITPFRRRLQSSIVSHILFINHFPKDARGDIDFGDFQWPQVEISHRPFGN